MALLLAWQDLVMCHRSGGAWTKLMGGPNKKKQTKYSETCTSLEKNSVVICKIKEIICKKLPKKVILL
jgi:hypothetical protein